MPDDDTPSESPVTETFAEEAAAVFRSVSLAVYEDDGEPD